MYSKPFNTSKSFWCFFYQLPTYLVEKVLTSGTTTCSKEMPSMYYCIYLNSLHMKKKCYVSAVCWQLDTKMMEKKLLTTKQRWNNFLVQIMLYFLKLIGIVVPIHMRHTVLILIWKTLDYKNSILGTYFAKFSCLKKDIILVQG